LYFNEKVLILYSEKKVFMYPEARKMRLIEEVIKTKNEAVLIELESVLRKSKSKDQPRPSAYDLIGLWSKDDADLIEKAIEESCEQINPDETRLKLANLF